MLRIVVILIVAWAVQAIAWRLIRAFRGYMVRRSAGADELRRIDTVGNAFRYFASVVVVLVAGMLVLNELGISIAPILATAGVAGIAIAFGAQSLIKDYFTGFFLLVEDQIRQGDVVEIVGKAGEVEEVTLRYVRLRDGDGYVHFVPNGEIGVVTSSSRTFAYAVVDVVIALDQDIEPVIKVMREIGAQMRAHAVFGKKILDDLDIAGIESWNAAGITLRARMKVQALEQSHVKREFLLRLKQAFDHHAIQQPRNTVTMIEHAPAQAKAPEGPPK